MHHWFGAKLETTCGEELHQATDGSWRTENNVQATGLDRLVTCNLCRVDLGIYRQHFPMAHDERMIGGRR